MTCRNARRRASMGITHADEAAPSEADMKIVCAWCETVMAEGDDPVSHGICNRCFAKTVEHRPVGVEEYATCLARAADIDVDGWLVWYLGATTVVVRDTKAWAFDCRLDFDMVKTHYQEVFT